jgi:hypothetical protein
MVHAQNLQHEREAWNKQATGSIGNKRSRSLSRSCSKSQNNMRNHQPKPSDETTFDFLAVRTLLGHQAVAPVVHTDPRNSSTQSRPSGGSGTGLGTLSSSSASHSRLRSKSHGYSSSGGTSQEGRGHRRNGSLIAVFKKAKSRFGNSVEPLDNGSEDTTGLEAALRSEGTKFIRLFDRPSTEEQNGQVLSISQILRALMYRPIVLPRLLP